MEDSLPEIKVGSTPTHIMVKRKNVLICAISITLSFEIVAAVELDEEIKETP